MYSDPRYNLNVNKINRSAIVPYSQEQMYKLVTDIGSYPEFLPWCSDTQIISADETETTAKLSVSFKGIKQNFTTRNINFACDTVKMELVDGPFSHLGGVWKFTSLSESASKIELKLEFAFDSKWLEKVLGPVFGMIGNTMVDSFQSRAKELYG